MCIYNALYIYIIYLYILCRYIIYAYIHYIWHFILLSNNKQLSCFCILTNVNNGVMNIEIHILFWVSGLVFFIDFYSLWMYWFLLVLLNSLKEMPSGMFRSTITLNSRTHPLVLLLFKVQNWGAFSTERIIVSLLHYI